MITQIIDASMSLAAYLIWLAPRYFDLVEPPDPALMELAEHATIPVIDTDLRSGTAITA